MVKWYGEERADRVANGKYEAALKNAFLNTDKDLRADPNFFNEPSGCTAVVTLVTQDGRIICVRQAITSSYNLGCCMTT